MHCSADDDGFMCVLESMKEEEASERRRRNSYRQRWSRCTVSESKAMTTAMISMIGYKSEQEGEGETAIYLLIYLLGNRDVFEQH